MTPTPEGQVELLVEGKGPRIVLLPRWREANGFDEIAPITTELLISVIVVSDDSKSETDRQILFGA